MPLPCRPTNASVLLATLPVFYIAKAPNPAVEERFRQAGACGHLEHVPAIMASDAFPPATPRRFFFKKGREELRGVVEGSPFAVRHFPLPPQSKESCPQPNLAEIGILLSHLRAMALALRHAMSSPRDGRTEAALLVEDDVDLRLVPLLSRTHVTYVVAYSERRRAAPRIERLGALM
jgi:hypothetical protein